MTREKFVTDYATRSRLSPAFACLGMVDAGSRTLVAMPCACGDDACVGWAMVTADSVLHHLAFDAPEKLRSAYLESIAEHDRA